MPESAAQVPDSHAHILESKALLHLALVLKDGTPQVSPVWFDTEGDLIRINSARGRLKDKVMRSRPAVAAARQFGFDRIGVVSTGNAATAIAGVQRVLRSQSDCPGPSQSADLVIRVPGLAQHLVGVLAQQRRRQHVGRGDAAEAEG